MLKVGADYVCTMDSFRTMGGHFITQKPPYNEILGELKRIIYHPKNFCSIGFGLAFCVAFNPFFVREIRSRRPATPMTMITRNKPIYVRMWVQFMDEPPSACRSSNDLLINCLCSTKLCSDKQISVRAHAGGTISGVGGIRLKSLPDHKE